MTRITHAERPNPPCHGHDHDRSANAPVSGQAIDPVCGMTVDPAAGEHHIHHAGREYHFCSAACLNRFEARPEIFLDGSPDSATQPAPAGIVYTCPMHPEVEQIGPGTCPICGMALEPKGASLSHG